MNTDALEFALLKAERRVLEMQTKLHCWATDDRDRRFDDLFNLVANPAFLLVAWDRVRRNRGARSAGVDGQTASATSCVFCFLMSDGASAGITTRAGWYWSRS
ncbi:hypothetical protein ACEYXF_03530 [Streptomyces asiaticus]|uniref:hypothetical protein n=1 Tax=Streptomyces asiaticus TaxID=114695 RepID=UPI0039BDB9EA